MEQKMPMNSDVLWEQLEAEARTLNDSGTLKRRISSIVICPMFLGIRQPGMKRSFIIQVPKEIAPLPEAISESKGLEYLVMLAGDENNKGDISIILSAAKFEYHDIFASVCNDLFEKLSVLQNKRKIVSAFINRVHLWQMFFKRQAEEGLNLEAQKGLFGELYFLCNYIIPHCNQKNCICYWISAENRQHDFQFGSLCVEVKTSSSKQHQVIHISSEQQLDETLVEELYLFILSISLVENSAFTLPKIVDEIRLSIADKADDLDLFDNILLARGYSDAQRTLYEHTGYSIRHKACFQIHDNFPRIKEAELRLGVGDVKYSIALNACNEYIICDDLLKNKLVEVMS